MSNIDTKLVNLGRNPKKYERSVNTPIYRSSTFIYESVEQFIADESPFHTDKSYGRSGTSTIHELQNAIAELEKAEHCLVTSSGISAIIISLLGFLKASDHALITDTAYKCTKRFVDEEFARLGIDYTYYNATNAEELNSLIKLNTKVIFLESPGSGTFEIQDIPAIIKIAKQHNIVTILDNTWATPLFFLGIPLGIDIVVQSLTKYFSGHADVIMGSIAFNNLHYSIIHQRFRNFGSIASAENAYLMLRSLRTLSLRLMHQSNSALKIAKWLENHACVEQVLYPALPSSSDYKLWKRDFKGASGVFGVILKSIDKETLYKFINSLKYFSIGLSWGGFESLIIPYNFLNVPSLSKRLKVGSYIRLNIGLESVEDLIDDLEKSLEILKL